MLGRMFAGISLTLSPKVSLINTDIHQGFFHPIIHLGFGVEFHQPAIIAEALAQACIHDTWTGDYLLAAEKAAAESPDTPSKSMKEILDLIHADKKLSTAAYWEDGNKIRDGILKRAKEEMLSYAIQWEGNSFCPFLVTHLFRIQKVPTNEKYSNTRNPPLQNPRNDKQLYLLHSRSPTPPKTSQNGFLLHAFNKFLALLSLPARSPLSLSFQKGSPFELESIPRPRNLRFPSFASPFGN